MENLGKWTENAESSITNRIQEIEERISDSEDAIEKINALIKENSKSNKFSSQNIQEMWKTIKKTKSKNNRDWRRRRTADQRTRKYIQQNYRRKLSQPNIPMKVQEAYRTPNRLDQKKIPSPYNNQNTKHTD